MKIDGNSWHCKVYQWWYQHKYEKKEWEYKWDGVDFVKHYKTPVKTNSNLCPYMRAVLIWAPMRALLWDWVEIGGIPLNAIAILVAFFMLPFLFRRAAHVLWMAYAVALIGFTVGSGCVWGVGLVVKYAKWGWVKRLLNPVADQVVKVGPPVASFGKLVKEYLRSAHDRVCPEVDWDEAA